MISRNVPIQLWMCKVHAFSSGTDALFGTLDFGDPGLSSPVRCIGNPGYQSNGDPWAWYWSVGNLSGGGVLEKITPFWSSGLILIDNVTNRC